jgi:hypothetical protein
MGSKAKSLINGTVSARYVRLSQTTPLFLVEQDVTPFLPVKDETPLGEKKVNHIFIVDVSGSMTHALPQLANDLVDKVKELPNGDTVTLGWFSSEGDYRFVIKGFKITGGDDFKVLEDTIRKNLHPRGCTCFSEILTDTYQVVEDLSAFGTDFALFFFTDGYPVVSNYAKEIVNLQKAIERVRGKIATALLVGYGNYYNRDLMTQMADWFGGSLVHSADMKDFRYHIEAFLADGHENDGRVEINIGSPSLAYDTVFSLSNRAIVTYAPDSSMADGTKIFYTVSGKGKKKFVYYLATVPPAGAKEVTITEYMTTSGATEYEGLVKAVYAAALILAQRTKTIQALEALNLIGDVSVMDCIQNAYTNDEYGRAGIVIQESMRGPKSRFRRGRKENYLPAPDAFCLLDLLKILQQDAEAKLYPRHKDFVYTKIGRSEKTQPGYPEFKADENIAVPLDELIWNDTKLNLSVRVQIPGIVELPDGHEDLGFAKKYPTHVWRAYTLVKDGFLNVQALPMSVSDATLQLLKDKELVDKSVKAGSVFTLDLTQLPIINRKIGEGKTSATELAQKAIQELRHEAKLKALRYFRALKVTQVSRAPKITLTSMQVAFLEKAGVGRNGFNPPTTQDPATDSYTAKEFSIKIKLFSSLPKIDQAMEKVKDGKNLVPSQQMIYDYVQEVEKALAKETSAAVQLAYLDNEIKTTEAQLLKVRYDIQATKFAIILGKHWFDEATSREDLTLTVDGFTVTIGVHETKVSI